MTVLLVVVSSVGTGDEDVLSGVVVLLVLLITDHPTVTGSPATTQSPGLLLNVDDQQKYDSHEHIWKLLGLTWLTSATSS